MNAEFFITETLNTQHINQLENLFKKMWWTKDRKREEILLMLQNSLSFGLIESSTQKLIGYARVLTDQIKYAFIFDVMTDENYRNMGLGKLLMDAIVAHPKLKNVKNFDLTCAPDMMAFYGKFGFSDNYGTAVTPMRYCRQE